MSPHETALLLQRGVTLDTISALDRAGCTTLTQLADQEGAQLAVIPGVGVRRAATIVRALEEIEEARSVSRAL